jgi:hypothetical protein
VTYLLLDFRLHMLRPLGSDKVWDCIEIADWKAMMIYHEVMIG